VRPASLRPGSCADRAVLLWSPPEIIGATHARKETGMAKATAKKKTKAVRDLAAKKQVKGGLRRTGDPCDGGEVARKLS
jgi:hypothetical protein